MLRCLFILAVVLKVQSGSAPFITPCKAGDSACALSSAQRALPVLAAGVPELGVPSVEPLHVAFIDGDNAGLQLKFTNTTVTGLKNCIIEAPKVDVVKNKQSLTLRCDVQLRGDYRLGGRLLVLPVQGQGKYIITIKEIVIKVTLEVGTVAGQDNEQHWQINSWKHNYNVRNNTHFQFQNLFNGNKALAEPVISFANSNWREVMQEVAPPVVKAIISQILESVKALYKAVPINQLVLQ